MDLQYEATEIINRPGVRSADRANLRKLVREMKRGRPLTYQQQQQLWAYINWYRAPR